MLPLQAYNIPPELRFVNYKLLKKTFLLIGSACKTKMMLYVITSKALQKDMKNERRLESDYWTAAGCYG